MVIRGGPLSCKANFVLLPATEKGEWPFFPHSVCKWRKSCRVDVYSYKRNQFADTVETLERKADLFLFSPSLFPNRDPRWRVCDNNYCRQLAGRSHLQMYWVWLLFGGAWFILSPRREDLCGCRVESPSFATNKGFLEGKVEQHVINCQYVVITTAMMLPD